jgi:imidazole glycerol phosphate synthase glutamine amidotransferase subunit
MIAVLDYGGGNVGSVLKAIEYLGKFGQRVDRATELKKADKVIFPGQGHFGAMMKGLASREMLDPLRDFVASGKPFLGICLGLQALYQASEEAPKVAGLGILPDKVRKFEGVFKIPHVGWSQISVKPETKLFNGVSDGSFVYYCHSYYGPVTPESCAITEYGQRFAAGIEMNNIWAVQFHPEKSGEVGLQVLRNFLEL